MSKRARLPSISLTHSSSPEEQGDELPSSTTRTKIHLSDPTSPTNTRPTPVMQCSLPPHRETTLSFTSYEDYEVHYHQAHVNRCSTCGKNFPTSHFLDLHIEENHDPLVAERRGRGEKTYGCFIEDCERKCSTPQKRRLHLIDKHMFPRSYNFYIVNDGIDKQSSMLRSLNRYGSHALPSVEPEEGRLRCRESPRPDLKSVSDGASGKSVASREASSAMDIDGLERSMSALRFVPPSVTRKR